MPRLSLQYLQYPTLLLKQLCVSLRRCRNLKPLATARSATPDYALRMQLYAWSAATTFELEQLTHKDKVQFRVSSHSS